MPILHIMNEAQLPTVCENNDYFYKFSNIYIYISYVYRIKKKLVDIKQNHRVWIKINWQVRATYDIDEKSEKNIQNK